MEQSSGLYIGVDVGTASVRAGLFDGSGNLIHLSTRSIKIHEPVPDRFEQSSADIWECTCAIVKELTKNVRDKSRVRGIGFDATCSMVVLDEKFYPVCVTPSGNDEWNVIMWMDHRAKEQAEQINGTHHKSLNFYGGKIFLEHEPPKLLWLKQNLDESTWNRAKHFFDLPDFLTFKATGSLSRSFCSLTSKWAYQLDPQVHSGYWDDTFWAQNGLEEMIQSYSKLGLEAKTPGEPVGTGLSSTAAQELGILEGTAVATSMIDAHAGGLGSVACKVQGEDEVNQVPLENRLSMICGTSTCHMAVNREQLFVNGMWGPFYSAMLPAYWLNEGGQSVAGKLIDHVIESHPAYRELKASLMEGGHVQELLNEMLQSLARANKCRVTKLAGSLHVYPDFHGNRSPLADSGLLGMISGLSLDNSISNLATLYLATIQALAYSTKHIIDAMTTSGHKFELLVMCGGLNKNELYCQMHADVTELQVVIPDVDQSIVLGSAMLGAYASGDFVSVTDAMRSMSGCGRLLHPEYEDMEYHAKKYKVFRQMVEDQRKYHEVMTS